MPTTTRTNRASAASLAALIAARLLEPLPGGQPGRAQLAEVAATIAEAFRPERIVLFGSHAYGDPDPDSDVDLMVVMDTPLPPPEQATRIRQALDPRPTFPLDILVRRPDQIERGLREGDFFIEDVIRKGITLYEEDRSTMAGGTGGTSGGSGATPSGQGGQPVLSAAAQGWLDKAESDLRSARRLSAPPDPLYETAAFHAQQSAEKDLKAFLQARGIRFPRTHELGTLADLAGQSLPGLAALRPDLDWLSDYAVDIRYPGTVGGQPECDRAIRVAEQVKALVRSALGLTT